MLNWIAGKLLCLAGHHKILNDWMNDDIRCLRCGKDFLKDENGDIFY